MRGEIDMGKKILGMFFKGFLQSFFIVALLLGAGVLGYQLTIKNLQEPKEEAILAYQEETVPESITQARIDDVSLNLIYCYNDDTNEITKLLLEIFNCKSKQLTYITIPMRTQITMSDSLYRKMITVNPQIPQVMLLSSMTKYLDSDTIFDYGVLMLDDLLSIDISYYTAIPQSIYDTIFTGKVLADSESNMADGKINNSSGQNLPTEVFTEDYVSFLKTIKTEEELSTYIESVYSDIRSNLSVHDKMNYLESYRATPMSNISFELISGDNQNSAFLIDKEQSAQRLKELTGDY